VTTIYDIGDAPQVTAEFRDLSDVLTNPTAVTAKMVEPDGTTTSLTGISNTGTGIYKVTLPTLDQSGEHVVKFFGTGTIIAAEEVRFTVRTSRVV
jgi:hypothetical protein